jgi:hypothetical protein
MEVSVMAMFRPLYPWGRDPISIELQTIDAIVS